MKLLIEDDNSPLLKDFGNWLIPQIKDFIISSLNFKKLMIWDNYLNNLSLKTIYKKRIMSRDIIIAAAHNLICYTYENSLIIEINPNIYIIGLDRVKLATLCKLINFGNQEIVGYPIFTVSLNYFASHIKEFMTTYMLSRRGV